jgi:antitoxin HicB
MLGYRVELTPDDNDTLLVTCPDLPLVTTFGETEADALKHAVDAVETALASMIEDGEDIPPPSGEGHPFLVGLPLMTILKVELYRRLRALGLTRADLVRRLGWHREQVDRLFRLDHNSRLDQIEAAFRALGQEIEIEIHEAA